VCGPRPRLRRCYVCRELGATRLCDGPPPAGSSRTSCSRPLHPRCSSGHSEALDRDFCPPCWRASDPDWAKPRRQQQAELFGPPVGQRR
jgi:hypothetical protein